MTEVTLRPLQEADAPHLYELVDRNREALSKFPWVTNTRSAADSQAFIRTVNELEQTNGAPARAICTTEGMVGVGALHTIDWARRSSILGYWIDGRQAGRGYTTEAARQLVDEGFGRLGLDELRVTACTENTASLRVAQKLGFTLLHITDTPTWQCDSPVETAIYTLYADQWNSAQGIER